MATNTLSADDVLLAEYPRIVRFATRFAQPDLAVDAVHDAICEVYERGADRDDPKRLVAYVFTWVRNKCVRQYRLVQRARYVEEQSQIFLTRSEGDPWEALSYIEERDPVTRRARQNSQKTTCHRGHAFDTKNTYVRKNGTRMCRTCHNARKRKGRG